MQTYQWLAEEEKPSRLTIGDALEVLRTVPGFTERPRAEARVSPWRLLSGEVVGIIALEHNGPLPEVVCAVSLPTSTGFKADVRGTARRQHFDILKLDGAAVDGAANVILADGTVLEAVEVVPADLPLDPSELDYRIVHYTIANSGMEDQCYRSLRYGVPEEQKAWVPDLKLIDCSRLAGLPDVPLKVIAGYIADHDPTLKKLSQQKIADALRKFGIRVPSKRPRRLRQDSAAI